MVSRLLRVLEEIPNRRACERSELEVPWPGPGPLGLADSMFGAGTLISDDSRGPRLQYYGRHPSPSLSGPGRVTSCPQWQWAPAKARAASLSLTVTVPSDRPHQRELTVTVEALRLRPEHQQSLHWQVNHRVKFDRDRCEPALSHGAVPPGARSAFETARRLSCSESPADRERRSPAVPASTKSPSSSPESPGRRAEAGSEPERPARPAADAPCCDAGGPVTAARAETARDPGQPAGSESN